MVEPDKLMAHIAIGCPSAWAGTFGNDPEYIFDYPAVDQAHQPITFGGGNKLSENHPPVFILQPQQNLDVPAAFLHLPQGRDFLCIEAEMVFFQRHMQTLHPCHFTKRNESSVS